MNTTIFSLARSLASPTMPIRTAFSQTIPQIKRASLLYPISTIYTCKYGKPYSSLSTNKTVTSINHNTSIQFLSPVNSMVMVEQPKQGFKQVANPKRRCKHCYIVIEDEMKYVFCDKYPRHKQVTKRPGPIRKVARILTHATQGGTKTSARMGMWTQQGLREDY